MQDGDSFKHAIPFETRCLLAAAGCLLPLNRRPDWLKEWFAEVWHWLDEQSDRGSPGRLVRCVLFRRSLGSLVDAWFLLRSEEGTRRRLKEATESPWAAIGSIALVLLFLAFQTRAFQESFTLLKRVFDGQSGSVILLSQPVPFMGGSARVPREQADFWNTRSRAVEALGKFMVPERVATLPGGRVSPWRVLQADRCGVELLGYKLGKGRWPLSGRSACELLTTAKSVGQLSVGEETVLDGQACRVVGVLESTDLKMALAFEAYHPLDMAGSPTHVGVIVRLKPGSTLEQAQGELAATAKLRKGWGYARAMSVDSLKTEPVKAMGWLFPLFFLVCACSVRAKTARAWAYGLLQIGLVFTLIALVWLELVARTAISETASFAMPWGPGVYFFPPVVGILAVWWLRREHGSKCRVCHRRLALAVSVGSTAGSLLNPGGVEYLCRQGHGVLVVGPAAREKGEAWASI
jgi:hypothetical protein